MIGTDHKARPCGVLAETRDILPKLYLSSHCFPPQITDCPSCLDDWRAQIPTLPVLNHVAAGWRLGVDSSYEQGGAGESSQPEPFDPASPQRNRHARRGRCRNVAFGAGIGHTVPLQRRLRRQAAERVTGDTVIRVRERISRSGGSGNARANRREAVCAACSAGWSA